MVNGIRSNTARTKGQKKKPKITDAKIAKTQI